MQINETRRHGRAGVRAAAVGIAAVIGALLMGACDPSPLTNTESYQVEENTLGPDVILSENDTDVTIWAMISATDEYGISVQGVKEGDTITIQSIGGIGWFTDQSGWRTVMSTIYSVSGQLTGASLAKSVIEGIREQTQQNTEEKKAKLNPKKARDGYGKDMDGNYAKNEGGIVVCMPSAHGPMYANKKNHLKLKGEAKQHGRFDKYMQEGSDMKGKCFFPTRIARSEHDPELDSVMEKKATEDGVLYILAFDSKYSDNVGGYEVKFRITRGSPD